MGKSQLIENQIKSFMKTKNVILNQITVKSQSNQIIYEKKFNFKSNHDQIKSYGINLFIKAKFWIINIGDKIIC